MSKHREAMAESIVNWRRGSSNSGHLFSAVLPPRSSPPLFNVALDLASARCTSQYNVCSLSKPCFRFLYRGQSRLISGHQKKRRRKIKRVPALRVTVFQNHEHYIYIFSELWTCDESIIQVVSHTKSLVTWSQSAFRELGHCTPSFKSDKIKTVQDRKWN